MEPRLAWSLRLFVLLLLRPVHAGWLKGAVGLNCDDACAAAGGQICSQEGNRRINFDYEMQYLMELNVTDCVPDQEGEDAFRVVSDTNSIWYPVQPFRLEIPGLPETACYIFGEGSTCDASNSLARRICCCVAAGGGDDVSTECFLPTTTSTTISMTTSKTTSFTETTTQTTTISVTTTVTTSVTQTATETTTSATQTSSITVTSSTTESSTMTTSRTFTTSVTTTSQTTSISFTQTTTTTSVTQTSVTSSTSTITTATSTYTGTLTETSTITTTSLTGTTRTDTTTISITTTFSTSTTTATTTTVTPRANTDITRDVPIGATQIAVDSTLGFSIGDIALIRSREAVEIINITYEVRRLEAVDKDFFAETDDSESEEAAWRRLNADGTVAILDVTPPVERAYPAGTRIINAGPAISYTGSDPITFFGGQKFKFWFPLHEEMLMLQTPELRIYGQVFPGPELGLQWFGHLRVLRTDGTPVARVNIKRGGLNHTSSRCSSRKLDSLDVFLGTSASPLRELNRRPMEFVAGKDVRFELNCRQQARPQLASSRTEYLHFETPSIAFLIVAAHAGNEFPNDAKLALKYKHLDFLILEMPRKETFTGVLPEIWGLVPRSPAVEAMLVPPAPETPQVCSNDRADSLQVCASA